MYPIGLSNRRAGKLAQLALVFLILLVVCFVPLKDALS